MSMKKARAFVAQLMEYHDHDDFKMAYARFLVENQDMHWSDEAQARLAKYGLTPDDIEQYLLVNGVEADDIEDIDSPYGPASTYVFSSAPVGEYYESSPEDRELEEVGITRKQFEKALDEAGFHVENGAGHMATHTVFYLYLTTNMCEACRTYKGL